MLAAVNLGRFFVVVLTPKSFYFCPDFLFSSGPVLSFFRGLRKQTFQFCQPAFFFLRSMLCFFDSLLDFHDAITCFVQTFLFLLNLEPDLSLEAKPFVFGAAPSGFPV